MGAKVIYPHERNFMGRLAINTLKEHLCDDVQDTWTICVNSAQRVDPASGHRVCCGCQRITMSSGLRECASCDIEFINLSKYQDPIFEVICTRCEEL